MGKEPANLTAAVRQALARIIIQTIYGNVEELPVVTLDPSLEQILLQSIQQAKQTGNDESMMVDPGLIEQLQHSMRHVSEQQNAAGKPAVIIVSGAIRDMLARIARHLGLDMHILAYEEVPSNKHVNVEGSVGGELALQAP